MKSVNVHKARSGHIEPHENAPKPLNDCIGFCSPGAVLTVALLVERITLHPTTGVEAGLCSDELYDVLIRPENSDIDRLLFISPHVLFDLSEQDSTKTLRRYVAVGDLLEADNSWHYPAPPTETNGIVKASLPLLTNKPDAITFREFTGTAGPCTVEIPADLGQPNVLGFLQGCGATVFELVFGKPVKQGENRWLRLRIKPPKLNAPGDVQLWKEACSCFPKAEYFQLLNILGADTMLASFKDSFCNLSKRRTVPQHVGDEIQPDVLDAATLLLDRVFTNGFEKKWTYTRIEDQRLFLLPRHCRIHVKHKEGSVKFIGCPKVKVAGNFYNCFCWSAGLLDFAGHDPVAVARLISEYMQNYATNRNSAKSKAYIVVATGVDYQLGCQVIDELETLQVLQVFNDDQYYCGDKPLGLDKINRWRDLVELSYSIASRFTLTKAHFRILFEANWLAPSVENK